MLPSTEYLVPFLTATLIFAVMPGPALLYSAAQAMAHGRAKAVMAVVGLHLGGQVHALAATLGLSAVFTHVPELYTLIKIAGALYLVWLGVCIIRSKGEEQATLTGEGSGRKLLLQGIVVEVLNPKTALFFIAFLPQFVDPAAGPVWLQFLMLGWIVNLLFTLADIAAICFTSTVMTRVRCRVSRERVMRFTGGGILVGLGAHLAISK